MINNKTKWNKAIQAIMKFKRTFFRIDKEEKTSNKLCGLLGEYYVLRELNKRMAEPKHTGGQGSYDISLNNDEIKIEVKTSSLKNEGIYSKGISFWGWVVKWKTKKRINYDFLVAVALDKNWKPKFYIFTLKEVQNSDVKISRYPSIEKAIQLFENKVAYKKARKEKKGIRKNRCIVEINSNPRKFLNRWDKIKW